MSARLRGRFAIALVTSRCSGRATRTANAPTFRTVADSTRSCSNGRAPHETSIGTPASCVSSSTRVRAANPMVLSMRARMPKAAADATSAPHVASSVQTTASTSGCSEAWPAG